MSSLAATPRKSSFPATIAYLMLLLLTASDHAAQASRAAATIIATTIPRSSYRSEDAPPWNPSAKIDEDGFLKDTYMRCPGEWEEEAQLSGKHGPRSRRFQQLSEIPVTIRQVPGDGNCLFHSIATSLSFALNGSHVPRNELLENLRQNSAQLRQRAVECLMQHRRLLFLQGHEYLRACDLVDAAAAQYGMTGETYCELMSQDSYWGGGPEIVALCNVLRRPIHVYELHTAGKSFQLRRMACFGSPRFDRREPLHILSADSRFPDVTPGRQHDSGNHFLSLFPQDQKRLHRKVRRRAPLAKRAGVRGGDHYEESEDHQMAVRHDRWDHSLAYWVSAWWSALTSFWTRPAGI